MGKTRLALHVAADVLEDFPDGVFFVALARLAGEPHALVGAIARTLGVIDEAGRRPWTGLRGLPRPAPHPAHPGQLRAGGGPPPFVTSLLTCCPRLDVLATSRSVLRLSGEQKFAVPPWSLPAPGPLPPAGSVAQYDAVRLFVERAQAIRPGPQPHGGDRPRRGRDLPPPGRPAPGHRAGGGPLQLPLPGGPQRPARPPGAWLCSPAGPRDRPRPPADPARHHRLELRPARPRPSRRSSGASPSSPGASACPPSRPSACPGPPRWRPWRGSPRWWTRASSRRPRRAPRWPRTSAPQPRFRMLNTVREFALHALGAGQEAAACERRHAGHWLAVAERARPGLHGPAQAAWLRRLELDQANLAQALRWTVTHGEATHGLRLAGALFRFWWVRGDVAEGRRWLECLLAAAGAAGPAGGPAGRGLDRRRHPGPRPGRRPGGAPAAGRRAGPVARRAGHHGHRLGLEQPGRHPPPAGRAGASGGPLRGRPDPQTRRRRQGRDGLVAA